MQQLNLGDYPLAARLGLAEYGHRRFGGLGVRGHAMELGADREQWQFSIGHQRYVLCLEHLCEAVWIEALGRADLTWLADQIQETVK